MKNKILFKASYFVCINLFDEKIYILHKFYSETEKYNFKF